MIARPEELNQLVFNILLAKLKRTLESQQSAA
jgi:hypothetical protein